MTTSGGTYDPGDRGPLGRAVAAVGTSVGELAVAPRLSASPGELGAALVEVTRQIARLTSVQLGLVADAERAGVGSEVGAQTVVWWANQSRVTRPATRAASRLSAALDPDTGSCRVVGQALGEGRVVEQQARVIVAALAALPTELDAVVRAEAERVLVDLAAHHDAHELRRLGRAVLEQVAPELAEEHEQRRLDGEERRAWEQIRFSMRFDGHGLAHGEFILPAAQGEMLRAMVMAFADARYRRGPDGRGGEGPGRESHRPADQTADQAGGQVGDQAAADTAADVAGDTVSDSADDTGPLGSGWARDEPRAELLDEDQTGGQTCSETGGHTGDRSVREWATSRAEQPAGPFDSRFWGQDESQHGGQGHALALDSDEHSDGYSHGEDEAQRSLRGEWATWASASCRGADAANPPDPPPDRPPDLPDSPPDTGSGRASWWDRPSPRRMGEAFADLIERIGRDELPTHGGRNPTVVVSLSLAQLTGRACQMVCVRGRS